MTSRMTKEQQAATSSNSLEENKDLLNARFSELSATLASLEEKLDNVTKDIHLKVNAVETTAQEASTYARENREDIHQLDIHVANLKNRSLRKTLVFRNIKKQQSEKTWDDTKMVLANEISKHMQDFSKEEIIKIH